MQFYLKSAFETYVAGEYHNPDPGAEFGAEGDCAVGNFDVPRFSGGPQLLRVNHITTSGTAYPGPGIPFGHAGLGILAYPPDTSPHYVGLSIYVPKKLYDGIASLETGYLQLQGHAPSSIDFCRPVDIRMYPDGRVSIGSFNSATKFALSSYVVGPDRWFYTVMKVQYDPNNDTDQVLYLYNENSTLVDIVTVNISTRGAAPFGDPGRSLVGGTKQYGLWPEQYNTYHDDFWVADFNAGPLKVGARERLVVNSPPDFGTPNYRVVVGDLHGNPIEEIPAKNLLYSFVLNGPGSCSFELPIQHPKATRTLLDPGQRSVLIYRNAALVWGGYLWTSQANFSEKVVMFGGEGWFSRLRHRYIDTKKVFTQLDQFEIAWRLIDTAQQALNGDLGIVRDSTALSGVVRDRTYNPYERKNLGEALTDLAAVENGFDFEITSDRRWVTYYPFKGVNAGAVFELGKNVAGFSWQLDATNMATEVTATGSGSGDTTLLAVAADLAAQAGYGLLQESTSYADVSVQATLAAHAAEDLAIMKAVRDDPQAQIVASSVEPPFGSYGIGDNVLLKADFGYIQINRLYRLKIITMAISDEGAENVGLFFDETAQ